MGAEAEARRERKGAGWAEEGRRGVGGLVERGSGAVWRYAGCLCGLSRGLIRYDPPLAACRCRSPRSAISLAPCFLAMESLALPHHCTPALSTV